MKTNESSSISSKEGFFEQPSITETHYITKKEFCQECNVSKSTIGKLLKNGEINYIKCNDRLLHYYKIHISEVEKYKQRIANKGVLSEMQSEKMRKYYKKKLSRYPDVIDSKDIQVIIGYGKETIRKWIKNEKILGVLVRGKFKVAKDDLIDFLLSSY